MTKTELRSTNLTSGKDATKISVKVQEIVTEFILFVTSEAVDRANEKGRGTIQAEDLLEALKTLGFDHYHYYAAQYN